MERTRLGLNAGIGCVVDFPVKTRPLGQIGVAVDGGNLRLALLLELVLWYSAMMVHEPI